MATRIALVTGGSRGLGKEMALALARKGFDVILTCRSNEKEGTAVVNEIENRGQKAALLQLNMSDFSSLGAFL